MIRTAFSHEQAESMNSQKVKTRNKIELNLMLVLEFEVTIFKLMQVMQ